MRHDVAVCNRVCLCNFVSNTAFTRNTSLLAVNQHRIGTKQQFKHSRFVTGGGNMRQCEAGASWIVYSELNSHLCLPSMPHLHRLTAAERERERARNLSLLSCRKLPLRRDRTLLFTNVFIVISISYLASGRRAVACSSTNVLTLAVLPKRHASNASLNRTISL